MTIDRTPYCTKIRYGVSGAPTIDGDDMDGSHAPGVGLAPVLIELIYSSALKDRPASVAASVTGLWTRFGVRDEPERTVTTHFKNGPDGWPAWLAEEARLHGPAASAVAAPATDPSAEVAKHVTRAIWALKSPPPPGSEHYRSGWDDGLEAAMDAARDALAAVLPADSGRADTLTDAERTMLTYALDQAQEKIWSEDGFTDENQAAVDSLRRMAADPAAPVCAECGHPKDAHTEGDDPVSPGRCGACDPDGEDWHNYEPAAAPAVTHEADTNNEADRIVAYRSPLGHYLHCTRHANELGLAWTPLSADDLPDGGICSYPQCGVDVLIPQEPAAGLPAGGTQHGGEVDRG